MALPPTNPLRYINAFGPDMLTLRSVVDAVKNCYKDDTILIQHNCFVIVECRQCRGLYRTWPSYVKHVIDQCGIREEYPHYADPEAAECENEPTNNCDVDENVKIDEQGDSVHISSLDVPSLNPIPDDSSIISVKHKSRSRVTRFSINGKPKHDGRVTRSSISGKPKSNVGVARFSISGKPRFKGDVMKNTTRIRLRKQLVNKCSTVEEADEKNDSEDGNVHHQRDDSKYDSEDAGARSSECLKSRNVDSDDEISDHTEHLVSDSENSIEDANPIIPTPSDNQVVDDAADKYDVHVVLERLDDATLRKHGVFIEQQFGFFAEGDDNNRDDDHEDGEEASSGAQCYIVESQLDKISSGKRRVASLDLQKSKKRMVRFSKRISSLASVNTEPEDVEGKFNADSNAMQELGITDKDATSATESPASSENGDVRNPQQQQQ